MFFIVVVPNEKDFNGRNSRNKKGTYMPYSTPRNLKPSHVNVIVEAVNKVRSGDTKAVATMKNGKLHSFDDMPSLIHMSDYTSESKEKSLTFDWHRDGTLHRDNGPASITINGQKELMFYWWKNGLRHGQLVTNVPADDGYFTDGVNTFWSYADTVNFVKMLHIPRHQGISMIVDFMPIPVHFPMKWRSEMRKPFSPLRWSYKNGNDWMEAMLEQTKSTKVAA
ncbi:hypothetical protein G6L58_19145 [Agrobacterium tumefaciens]|uniref:hypothetical protein n=1 Tax=Agrobacterium tumefaciens TaxID=358 RepID=UPI0013CF0DD2|nr:hypothetical protein [Agrobacterium tumefaciens]